MYSMDAKEEIIPFDPNILAIEKWKNTIYGSCIMEYARLYLDGTMQMWIDAEDSLEVW